jgi:hypothetical protein
VLDECDVEVEEQAQPALRQTEIGEYLEVMDGLQPLHGLELHDDKIINQQIETEAEVEGNALVSDWDRNLVPDFEASQPQLVDQARLIDGLQQSWPQVTMHLNGRSDDLVRQRLRL